MSLFTTVSPEIISESITVSDLTINIKTKTVTRSNYSITLRKKEFELLYFLVVNRGTVINRLTLLEYVWNYSADIPTNTLEVHINSLRAKLNRGFQVKLIETIYGIGYRLQAG